MKHASVMHDLLHPRSVAIVGASEDESKWGGRLLRYMTRHRIQGELYPINPKGGTLMGVKTYASLSECPGPIDMAILLVPSSRALAAVRDCVANKVKVAIAITSGFAEAGPEGEALQQAVLDEAKAGGLRLFGPNCMGLMNTHHNLAATTAVSMGYLETLPVGCIGMASQSGALMGALLARGIDVGAGFSTMVSLGNQADIDQNDIFDYLIQDPHTKIIALYMEAVKEPERFVQLLKQAQAAAKPVLIVKSGRTEAGERAVQSHTASLAGAWPSFEAVCRAHGVYLFDNVFDLLNGAMVLQRGASMNKPGLAVFSGSGGGGALFVDALDEAGLSLPALSEQTKSRLQDIFLPVHRELPVDFGVVQPKAPVDPVYGDPVTTAIGRVMEDESIGAGIVFLTTQPGMQHIARATAHVGMQCGKPLLFVHGASTVGEEARAYLREQGYGYVESPNDAMKLCTELWRRQCAALQTPVPASLQAADLAVPAQAGFLSEPQARRLLESAKIPLVPSRLAKDEEQAVQAAREWGGSVVIKAVSPTLIHKSDIGAVKLNLDSEAKVRVACQQIQDALGKAGHTLESFIVSPMLQADAELIVGIQRDPDFGPMVMLGAGGVLVELLNDVQLCPAPLSADQALAMLNNLRCRPLLEGWRGRQPLDKEKLVHILVQLGQLALALPRLTELDINPLLIVDGQPMAVDARATIA